MKGRILVYRFLPLLIGGLTAWGCSSHSPRAASYQSPRSPHEPADAQADFPTASGFNRGSAMGGASEVVDIAFELLRAELPVESIRHSQKVWNHIDEQRIDPTLSARLARNGLRLGAASVEAWPAMRAILDSCGAQAQHEQLRAPTGLPLVVDLGSIDSSESIFSYAPNGRLVGKTFPEGRKLLNLAYNVHPELGGYVDLKVSLEVRHDRGVMTWERQGGIIRQVPAVDRQVFEDLKAVLSLNAGEFLVIGPGEEADNEYLVGSRFFMRRQGDGRYEVLLVITPLPYRTRNAGPAAVQKHGDE